MSDPDQMSRLEHHKSSNDIHKLKVIAKTIVTICFLTT